GHVGRRAGIGICLCDRTFLCPGIELLIPEVYLDVFCLYPDPTGRSRARSGSWAIHNSPSWAMTGQAGVRKLAVSTSSAIPMPGAWRAGGISLMGRQLDDGQAEVADRAHDAMEFVEVGRLGDVAAGLQVVGLEDVGWRVGIGQDHDGDA